MGYSRFWLKAADEESKSITHEFPRSHWLKATGQCVLERYLSVTMLLVLVFFLYPFRLKALIEFLGETRIIIIIILMIIISAGTPLVSNSFHFTWNPKYIEFWDQYVLVSS